SLLDHGQLHAELAGGRRGGARVAGAHRGLPFVEVAGGDGDVRQRLAHPAPGLLAGLPEHRPVVQVEHGDAAAAAGAQRGQGGGAAGLGAQPGDGGPEDPGRGDRVQVQLLGADLQVGGLGVAAVEVEREVVGREDLAEGDRGGPAGDLGDEPVVDAEAAQLPADEPAERVGAGAGDDGGRAAVPGGGDRHVGGAAAQVLAERGDLVQADPDLV